PTCCSGSRATAGIGTRGWCFLVQDHSRKQLRAQLRAARRAIGPMQRILAAKSVAHHVDSIFHLHAGQRVALYSSLPEELDTAPLIAMAQARGCRIYLPRIDRRTLTLRFVETGRHWSTNHLGIAEPRGSRIVGARWLDLVLLP